MKPERDPAVGCSALVRPNVLSIILTDEVRNESVRVEIDEDTASVTGRGDVLNWFCEQVPHFRGLFGGESLPEGAKVYVRVRDVDNNPDASPRLYRASLAASTEANGPGSVQRMVRPESDSHISGLCRVRCSSVPESEILASERILQAVEGCSLSFEATVGSGRSHQLAASLVLWKALHYPRPEVRIVATDFEVWFPEFVRFLATYMCEAWSNAPSSPTPTKEGSV